LGETETADLLEWRASPWWVWSWVLILGGLVLPLFGLMAWLAFRDIAGAPEGTWPLYIVFLKVFVGSILGLLAFGVVRSIVSCLSLLFDNRPILRADVRGVEIRAPLKASRLAPWKDIQAIEIERKREMPRRTVLVNHVLFRLRDPSAAEFSIKPQMAGLELEAGHQALLRLHARYRQLA
jgi:hypothetical protein